MSIRHHGKIFILAVPALCAAAIAGCAEPGASVPMVEQSPPPASAAWPAPREPELPVTSNLGVTLFGEFPGGSRAAFEARATAAMKQHTTGSEGADFDPHVSPDGGWLVFASTRHSPRPDLYLKTIDGQAITQLTSDPGADVQPAFAPDGRRIAFASDRAGNWDIWMLDLDRKQVTQITHAPLHEVHPTFAPDGRRLAYCAFNDRSGQWELWVLHLDQPGSRRMIGAGLYPQWSPVGESILYQRARQRGGRWFSIWRVDLENGEPTFPQELAASTEMALIQPAWSSDGTWIAYGTARLAAPEGAPSAQDPGHETRGDIWMIRVDGTGAMRLTDGSGVHFGPAWGRDGRVYFSSRQDGSENIWSVRAIPTSAAPLVSQPQPPSRAAPAAHVPLRGG